MNTFKNTLLLIVRLVAGGLLAYHVYPKFINLDGTASFFTGKLGLSTTVLWAVIIGETVAALGLILGAWTRWSAALAGIIMLGVFYFASPNRDSIIILIGSLITLFAGAGQYALCRNTKNTVVLPDTNPTV